MYNEWYIELKYGLFRDYRIVRMCDANGVKRDGIFIPFIQNGIKWDGVKVKNPVQYLKPIWAAADGSRLHKLVPMVSVDFRQKMEDAGVLSPDDKYPCDTVGYVYKDKNKIYFPDFYIPKFNLVCEIKSDYYYNKDLELNLAKKEAASSQGYNFLFIIDKNYNDLLDII